MMSRSRLLLVLIALVGVAIVVTVAISTFLGKYQGGLWTFPNSSGALVIEFVLLGILLYIGLVGRASRKHPGASPIWLCLLLVADGFFLVVGMVILFVVTCSVAVTL
jgi:hypothetical protein